MNAVPTIASLLVDDPKAQKVGAVWDDDKKEYVYRGARQTSVAVQMRDDPLGELWAKQLIDQAMFNAGRHWRRAFLVGQRGPASGHREENTAVLI